MAHAQKQLRHSDSHTTLPQKQLELRTTVPLQKGKRTSGVRYKPMLEERYLPLDRIGIGGFSAVYKARDKQTGQIVAIKAADMGLAQLRGVDRGRLIQLFEKEAEALEVVDSPYVVRMLERGAGECTPCYLALEYIDGEDLFQILCSQKRSEKEIMRLFVKICDAISALHGFGVLHRDLKHSNVIVSEENGSLKATLVDFGSAHVMGLEDHYRGEPVGTWGYMAPEYLLPGHLPKPDQRSDLYSVGVMLYEQLAKACLFHIEGEANTDEKRDVLRMAHLKGYIPSLSSLEPELHMAVAAVVHKALSVHPDHRHQSAEELKHDLQRCIALMD